MNVEYVNIAISGGSLLFGMLGGVIAGVWRLARIEGRLKLHIHHTISDYENKFEEKLDDAVTVFDETLKGLRQKVNDIEKESLRLFVMKDDFNEFRSEYREDIRDIKNIISGIAKYRGQ